MPAANYANDANSTQNPLMPIRVIGVIRGYSFVSAGVDVAGPMPTICRTHSPSLAPS